MQETTELRNPVSGPVQVIASVHDYLELFDASVRDIIFRGMSQPHVTGACCFEVLQLDSSQAGRRCSLIFGPGCTRKTAEECVAAPVGSTPSTFAYPKYIYFRAP